MFISTLHLRPDRRKRKGNTAEARSLLSGSCMLGHCRICNGLSRLWSAIFLCMTSVCVVLSRHSVLRYGRFLLSKNTKAKGSSEMNTMLRRISALFLVLMMALSMGFCAIAESETNASGLTIEVVDNLVESSDLGTVDPEDVAPAEESGEAAEAEEEAYVSPFAFSAWSLLPPVIAIALALITKEVYSSLFIGILSGALLYANFNFELTFQTVIGSYNDGGFITMLTDSWNVGILVFLVMLGAIVSLVNKAGGSAAYGEWASRRIGSRRGAGLATLGLGVLIFVDDYFNCLTVGSVMRPVTDKQRISRAKLAYIIDSTAAPVCIIAPISSWAAAVAVVVEGYNGLELFIRAIPYNFYAILTLVMVLYLCRTNFDYGPMRRFERNAQDKGDLYTTKDRPYANAEAEAKNAKKGKVVDLVLPVLILIVCCIIGMIYTGDFFSGESFINAFANCDASVGLALGSFAALLITFFIYVPRRVVSFREFMDCIPDGFRQMVPAIMILLMAWTLSGMTSMLGAKEFVAGLLGSGETILVRFLPFIVFLIAVFLSFATGTSWGTFGILLPIVTGVLDPSSELMIITISACLAGAVCGDHCSPISDTTIMASTGAQCNHLDHVSTQLPYAMTVAGVSALLYVVAGFIQSWIVMLPLSILAMVGVLTLIRMRSQKKA